MEGGSWGKGVWRGCCSEDGARENGMHGGGMVQGGFTPTMAGEFH